jgi:hypothetical protein
MIKRTIKPAAGHSRITPEEALAAAVAVREERLRREERLGRLKRATKANLPARRAKKR